MKVEILHRTSQEAIATYDVPDLSILDFQEWEDLTELKGIPLSCLKSRVSKLVASKDSEVQQPRPNPEAVDFYLPDPIKNRMLSRIANSETDGAESPELFLDKLNEVTEQASMPMLKTSTVLSAVVTEILQNHSPHSDYEVRISDG